MLRLGGKITQSWRTDTIARRLTFAIDTLNRYFTKWKLRVNVNKTEAILFTKRRPAAPPQPQFQRTVFPWIRYLGLVLDPKLLFTKHLHAVTHKGIEVFLQLFPLLARDSTLSLHNKLTLYKLLIRPYSLMLPQSGATHHFPIIDISKYYNPNVLELSVTTPDVLLSPTSTPLSYLNPFVSFIA